MTNQPKITLTIAGNDASGGAGIAADLKTFAEYGTFGIAILTVIATMDPHDHWKHHVTPLSAELVTQQLETATSGASVDAFKTGMLPNVEVIQTIADHIRTHQLSHYVCDPVMVCKGEDEVLNPENANALRDILTPLATIVTPNLFEAAQIAQVSPIHTIEEAKVAAKIIHSLGAENVIIKGGTALSDTEAIDIFYDGHEYVLLREPQAAHSANHGAGCTFAAAVTAGLAQGLSPLEAVKKAKKFVTAAIVHGFEFNEFAYPVFHSAYRLFEEK
ncbi:bifunctional hydroxymethylpyrimidine kinase/phosphomethylpyrimidine kinase [Allofustis seminis]|uniref:bifunctional hydroxymethylpyrimidine kinase/phosphomethylpyrimidine kinase n=1 Tax=Allofustis seminis TaxID=166939 RepID=UPI0003697890|nr:bifunctional hydroxymethylpyrimidine kinase/phosphomethylpyrimidine kinase [Allofustis seminis]